MKIEAEVDDYPNPRYKWARLLLDGEDIGQCEKVDGGFMLRGGRKLLSLRGAAEAVLRQRLKKVRADKTQAISDEEWLLDMLNRLALEVPKQGPNGERT